MYKVGLTIQPEPTNDGGNWGATGEEIPPLERLTPHDFVRLATKRRLAFKGESRQPCWELRSHNLVPFVVALTYMVLV